AGAPDLASGWGDEEESRWRGRAPAGGALDLLRQFSLVSAGRLLDFSTASPSAPGDGPELGTSCWSSAPRGVRNQRWWEGGQGPRRRCPVPTPPATARRASSARRADAMGCLL
ncbi:unnamed protein product, partial [Urochloa humidicola]